MGQYMGRTFNREYHQRWSQTESGKASRLRRRARYEKSAKGKAQQKRQKARIRKRNQAVVKDFKNRPCEDCGMRFPICCMDLHHERDKDFNPGRQAHRSLTRLMEELAKCSVLCAVCHRLRHFNFDFIDSGLGFVIYR